MQHIMAKGWLKQLIPPLCEEAQMTRGHIELKKGPPGGFYPGGRTTKAQNMQDALLIVSACFCGSRWLRGHTFTGHSPRWETIAILLHRDQIHGRHKCRSSEEERSFMRLRRAPPTTDQLCAHNRVLAEPTTNRAGA